MNHDSFRTFGGLTNDLIPGACRAPGQTPCSQRKAGAILAGGRNGPKEYLTRCEVDAFLLLAPGDRVVVLNHETGEVWRGSVDAPFPEHGFVWVFTNLGERKMFDIALHTVWRSDARQVCGSSAKTPASPDSA